MILESLAQYGHRVARYATVCREWQAVIEHTKFIRLKLTPSRLATLSKMPCRYRGVVKHIWLCIELQPYDCVHCAVGETEEWYESNTAIINRAIRALFLHLSKWEPGGDLLLDISVHSPSVLKHHFKYLKFSSESVPEPDDEQENANTHDPRHGWVSHKQVVPPPYGSIDRLFEMIQMSSDFWNNVPEVTAVTGLLLRR